MAVCIMYRLTFEKRKHLFSLLPTEPKIIQKVSTNGTRNTLFVAYSHEHVTMYLPVQRFGWLEEIISNRI